MTKRKKPVSGTWYAVQAKATKAWLFITKPGGLAWTERFTRCDLWRSRRDAVSEGDQTGVGGGYVIVPVRCRSQMSKRANPKRTR